MKFTKRLTDAFNEQIKAEMWSSNLYASMAIYFQRMGLSGCAHWMKKQAAEELEHANKLIDNLMDVAVAENDKATQEFLRWFVNEQVEEEENAQSILDKFNVFGVHGLYCVDHDLAKR